MESYVAPFRAHFRARIGLQESVCYAQAAAFFAVTTTKPFFWSPTSAVTSPPDGEQALGELIALVDLDLRSAPQLQLGLLGIAVGTL